MTRRELFRKLIGVPLAVAAAPLLPMTAPRPEPVLAGGLTYEMLETTYLQAWKGPFLRDVPTPLKTPAELLQGAFNPSPSMAALAHRLQDTRRPR